MTLVPEIREQLLGAAFSADQSRPRRARRRLPFGHVAIAASVVISVLVAAMFVLGVHRSAAPPSRPGAAPPSPPATAWVKALGRASSSTSRRHPECRLPTNRRVRNQRFLTTAPPRNVTSVLPSLGSPPPAALKVTVSQLRARHIDANGIYARYAWQGYADGVHYYVVPAAVVGATRTLPDRCYRDEIAAFRRQARRFPASRRAAAIAYAQQMIGSEAGAGVALLTSGWGTGGGSFYPASTLALLNAEPDVGSGGGGNNTSTTTPLLVPNEVTSVTATYHAQSYPGRVPRTFSVTKHPVRNVVIFHLSGAWDPPQLTFRSRSGAIIARTPRR